MKRRLLIGYSVRLELLIKAKGDFVPTRFFFEVIGSPDFTSSIQTVLSLSQGGDSGPCSNLQQLDDSAVIVVPSANVRVDFAKGFVLKSILKKPRRTKQKWSPRSANQV
ncbi:hypothetical protein Nepgr_007923 [Nepenthes gracilis]|uniref:Uncharacterized protein n=1 Tax=Nepenthes gracilis TaxID=150966 RepID=A0AAD3S7W8_NEPGR|nr:hypothetical protein Nepgr_007923 [Nepenthes gracilis]